MKFAQKLVLVPQEEWKKNKIKRCPRKTSVSECSSSEGSEISTSENTDINISEGIRENSTEENSRGGTEVINQLLTPKQE